MNLQPERKNNGHRWPKHPGRNIRKARSNFRDFFYFCHLFPINKFYWKNLFLASVSPLNYLVRQSRALPLISRNSLVLILFFCKRLWQRNPTRSLLGRPNAGKSFWCPVLGKQGRVALPSSGNSPFEVSKWQRGSSGRIVSVFSLLVGLKV